MVDGEADCMIGFIRTVQAPCVLPNLSAVVCGKCGYDMVACP